MPDALSLFEEMAEEALDTEMATPDELRDKLEHIIYTFEYRQKHPEPEKKRMKKPPRKA